MNFLPYVKKRRNTLTQKLINSLYFIFINLNKPLKDSYFRVILCQKPFYKSYLFIKVDALGVRKGKLLAKMDCATTADSC